MSLEFLAESGGVFTKNPPRGGVYFDLNSGEVRRGLVGELVMRLPNPSRVAGRRAGYPIFSTHVSRNAGRRENWGEENPLGVFRKSNRIMRQDGFVGRVGEGEAIDLLRFAYEIQRMVMLDTRKLSAGYVYDGCLDAKNHYDIRLFGFFPGKMDFSFFQQSDFVDFRAASEPIGGRWGRECSTETSFVGERPIFTIDKRSGLLLRRGEDVVGHGFPKVKKDGRAWFTNWKTYPGSVGGGEGVPKQIDGSLRLGHSGVFVNLEKIPMSDRTEAVIETLSGLCYLEGPRKAGVLRATGNIIDTDRKFGFWLRTKGTPLKNISVQDWGKTKQQELARLALLIKDVGLDRQARKLLEKQKSWGGKKTAVGKWTGGGRLDTFIK